MKRTEEEIYDVIDACIESENTGESKYPAMTYEQGVRAALEWVNGDTDDNPMED